MSKKQENKKESWLEWVDRKTNNPAVFCPLIILTLSILGGLIVSIMAYWWTPSCFTNDFCTFDSHGYTLGSIFWSFLFITEVIFLFSLLWVKRKKTESIWHYTFVMKLYSMLFSLIGGVICYVVVLPLSWVMGKFIVHLPKIILWIILNVWRPVLLLVVLASGAVAWYLINVGLVKLFGSQDG